MDAAIQYLENMLTLVGALLAAGYRTVEIQKGRRYDKVLVDDGVLYFVDKHDTTIYGAKSATQHNTRRTYGTLSTLTQYDWTTSQPRAGTEAEAAYLAREAAIAASYKKRGRPRKTLVGTP